MTEISRSHDSLYVYDSVCQTSSQSHAEVDELCPSTLLSCDGYDDSRTCKCFVFPGLVEGSCQYMQFSSISSYSSLCDPSHRCFLSWVESSFRGLSDSESLGRSGALPPINVRELQTSHVLSCVSSPDSRLFCASDENTAAMFCLNKQGNAWLTLFCQEETNVWSVCMRNEIMLKGSHIPGSQKCVAGHLSRSFSTDCDAPSET